MKKLLVYLLPGAVALAGIGASVATQASAAAIPKPVHTSATSIHDSADDLFGIVGDVLVDGCKPGETQCERAWQDLGRLAGKGHL